MKGKMNRVIYISNYIDPKDFECLFKLSNGKIQQQNQRFHSMFIKSISSNYEVKVLPVLPVNRNIINKTILKLKKHKTENVYYRGFLSVNIPFIKQIVDIFQVFTCFFKSKKDSIFIVDSMCYTGCIVIRFLKKLSNSKFICINTDLPFKYANSSSKGASASSLDRVLYKSIKSFDAFINITENIEKELVTNKPVLIINGFLDIDKSKDDISFSKHNPFRFAYAGALSRANGIDRLINAFKELPDYELYLFGIVMDKGILNDITKNIHYIGNIYNEDLNKHIKEMDCLINPRPSNLEYTLYSFPSKTFDYIKFNKPILTTRLRCYSKEIIENVYILSEESTEMMSNCIIKIANLSSEELIQKIKLMNKFANNEYSIEKNSNKILNWITSLKKNRN